MAKPRVRQLALELAKKIEMTSEPRHVADWVGELLRAGDPDLSELAIAEQAEELAERVYHELVEIERATVERHEAPRFSFSRSRRLFIQGFSHVCPADAADLVQFKNAHAHRDVVLQTFDELDPRSFETLCTTFLSHIGARNVHSTPVSHDEGIDFYGELSATDLWHGIRPEIHFYAHLRVWIVGQAKHYLSGHAGTPDLRDITGAIALAKGRAYSGTTPKYTDLVIRACDPVVALFMTTGPVSAEARQLAERGGIVVVDGLALAGYLCDQLGLETESWGASQVRERILSYCTGGRAEAAKTTGDS